MKLKMCVLLGLACALLASPVLANPTGTVKFTGLGAGGAYSGFHAGVLEFEVLTFQAGGPAPGVFDTFCVEFDEHVAQYQIYDAEVALTATLGGVGSAGNGYGDVDGTATLDPLGNATAWTYARYLGLTSDTNTYTEMDYAMAIWYLEDELNGMAYADLAGYGNAQTLVDSANAAVQGGWVNGSNADGAIIAVLNLEQNDAPKQDILVQVPYLPNVPEIPAPGAIVLGGLGMGLVGWLRRRRSF